MPEFSRRNERLSYKIPVPANRRRREFLPQLDEAAERMAEILIRQSYPDATIIDISFVGDTVRCTRASEAEEWREVRSWESTSALHYVANVDFLTALDGLRNPPSDPRFLSPKVHNMSQVRDGGTGEAPQGVREYWLAVTWVDGTPPDSISYEHPDAPGVDTWVLSGIDRDSAEVFFRSSAP